jgi:hypothetical protein
MINSDPHRLGLAVLHGTTWISHGARTIYQRLGLTLVERIPVGPEYIPRGYQSGIRSSCSNSAKITDVVRAIGEVNVYFVHSWCHLSIVQARACYAAWLTVLENCSSSNRPIIGCSLCQREQRSKSDNARVYGLLPMCMSYASNVYGR